MLAVKNLPASAGDVMDMGLIPGLGSPLKQEMPTCSVFLPGKSHGQRSLMGCSIWGCKELDTTEPTE